MDTDNNNSDESYESSETSPQRSALVRSAIKILEKKKHFHKIKELGTGTYGDVYLMYDPNRKSKIAAKIVTSDNISDTELKFWPNLLHRNVVPLLELMYLRTLDVAVFIMPVLKSNLNDIMYNKRFRKRTDCFKKVQQWLYEVLRGLEYLHSNGLCHLDLKVDNVLISDSSTAMLCDFSFLNNCAPLYRYDIGLPYIYRPPEVCKTLGADICIEGKSYDSWSFGIMALEIFTHFYMAHNLTRNKCWLKDVYPTLFEIMQESRFISLMSNTFIGVHLTEDQARKALNFIHGFLMVDYTKRISILEATQHPFLLKGTIEGTTPDSIWKRKVTMDIKRFNDSHIRIFDEYDHGVCQDKDVSNVELEGDQEINTILGDSSETYIDLKDKITENNVDLKADFYEEIDLANAEPNEVKYPETFKVPNILSTTSYDAGDEKSVVSSPGHITKFSKFLTYKNSIDRLKIKERGVIKNAENGCQDFEESTGSLSSCDSDYIVPDLEDEEQTISNYYIDDHPENSKTSSDYTDGKTATPKLRNESVTRSISRLESSQCLNKLFVDEDTESFSADDFPGDLDLQVQENIIDGPVFDNELVCERTETLNDDPNFLDYCLSSSSGESEVKTESTWATGDSLISIHPQSKVEIDEENYLATELKNDISGNQNQKIFEDTDTNQQFKEFPGTDPSTQSLDLRSEGNNTLEGHLIDENPIVKKGKGRRQKVTKWIRKKCQRIEKAVRRLPYKPMEGTKGKKN